MTITNATGTKKVKISTQATGTIAAAYVQVYQNEEQLLNFKTFAKIENAKKWANKVLFS